jgi:beta-lactam-binding protein with PASTA domain
VSEPPPPPSEDWPTEVAPPEAERTIVGPGAPVPPSQDPRRRPIDDLGPWLLALAVLVIGGLVALWYFGFHQKASHQAVTTTVTQPSPATTGAASKVALPRVIGLTQADATAKLARLGLRVEPHPVKSTAASGTVLGQKPAAGAQLKRGAAVSLDVARGKPTIVVPDETGKPAAQAVAALRTLGLNTAVSGVRSAQPKGTVIAETPAPGTKAAKGDTIALKISQGAPPPPAQTQTTAPATTAAATTTARTTTTQPTGQVRVPSVVGRQQTPALRALIQAGLSGQVVFVRSQQPEGTVISALPAAGTALSRNAVVKLSVSSGPSAGQPTQVPDVTGEDVNSATTDLQNAGFTVEKIDKSVTSASQNGMVIDEQPAGGTQAPEGAKITIVVARSAGG